MYIRELIDQEFIDFTNTFENKSIYQTPEYASVMHNQGFETMTLGLIHNNDVIAASVILVEKVFGFKYAYAPRGFLIDYTDIRILETFTVELKKYLNKHEIIAIKVNPPIIRSTYNAKTEIKTINPDFDDILENLKTAGYFHLGYNSFFESLKPRFEAIMDISIPYEQLFANFKRNLRTKIRNAETNGIKIYKTNDSNLEYLYLQTKAKYPRDLNYFKEIYAFFEKREMVDFYYAKLDTAKYLNEKKVLYDKYEQLSSDIDNEIMHQTLKRDKLITTKLEIDKKFHICKKDLIDATKLLNANPNGIVLASVLIIKNQDCPYIIMDGYDTRYKKFNTKHLLFWKIMEKYHKQGYPCLNLGGMTELGLSDNKFNGLNSFKLGFNPVVTEYIGDFELVTNNALYFMYRNAKPIRSILKK